MAPAPVWILRQCRDRLAESGVACRGRAFRTLAKFRMNHMTFRIDAALLRLSFSTRAWRLLSGSHFEIGKEFVRFCGVYDRENFSVATGLKKGAHSIRDRFHLQHLAGMLSKEIAADADLLTYDYRGEIFGHTGRTAATLNGCYVHVSSREPGFCYLNVYGLRPDGTGRVVQWIDLRSIRRFPLDKGAEVVVRKKKQKLEWLTLLKKLTRFLDAHASKEVRIEFKE